MFVISFQETTSQALISRLALAFALEVVRKSAAVVVLYSRAHETNREVYFQSPSPPTKNRSLVFFSLLEVSEELFKLESFVYVVAKSLPLGLALDKSEKVYIRTLESQTSKKEQK